METILRAGEGRYPTPDEARRIVEVARAIERRIATVKALEAKEAQIVKLTTEAMLRKFPSFRERPMAEEKTARDLGLTLRYIGHAVLRNDPEFLREKILYWMQGIFASKAFGDVVRATWEILAEVVAQSLPKPDADEVNRFVQVCLDSCPRAVN